MERWFNRTTLIMGLILGLTTGCGSNSDDDDSSGSGSSALVTGISSVNSQLNSMGDVIVPSSGSSSVGGIGTFSQLDSVWTTSGGVHALSNTGSESLSDWLGHMFDPTFTNSNSAKVTFEGRIANSLMVLCVIGAAGLAADSTGLPTDGTHSITLTTTMLTSCGESDTSMAGATISAVVSTLSDTTIYDKSIVLTLPGSESCPFRFMARANSSAINIATGEDQSCESRDHGSRGVVRYDISGGKFRFYYISEAFSGSSSGFEFYRGYYNAAAEEAYILGFYGGDDNSSSHSSSHLDNYIGFTVSGKPDGTGTVAVSAKVKGQASLSDGVYNGCVNSSDGSISSSTDTLACTLTGTSMSSAYSTITTEYDSYSSRSQVYTIDATTDVDFTDNTDLF